MKDERKASGDTEPEGRADSSPDLHVTASPRLPGIVGIGVDIVETARIESSIKRLGERFLQRVFTEGEIAYCAPMKYAARHYAARFAAKEAVSKAFGTGIGAEMEFRDIEVCRTPEGRPFVMLHGGAKVLAEKLKVHEVLLSLSHSDHYAVASVVLEQMK